VRKWTGAAVCAGLIQAFQAMPALGIASGGPGTLARISYTEGVTFDAERLFMATAHELGQTSSDRRLLLTWARMQAAGDRKAIEELVREYGTTSNAWRKKRKRICARLAQRLNAEVIEVKTTLPGVDRLAA
jgi:hypothetical protein